MKTRLWLYGLVIAMLSIAASPILAATACQVSYTVHSQWNTGFTAGVKITNLGDPLSGWKVSWDMPSGQKITNSWNGQTTQSQAHVDVTNLSWNQNIATGSAIDFGFNGSYSDANNSPTNISVNGVICSGQAAPPAPAVVACAADYKIVSQWGTGATVAVTIRNNGSALSGWKVAWDMPNGQTVTQAWNAQGTQTAARVVMSNLDWNKRIASGTDIQFGFNASHTGTNGIPGNLSLNGVACAGQTPTPEPPPPPPPPTVTLPTAPSALTATVIDNGAVSLAWTDQSANEQGFRVQRRLAGDTTWSTLTDTAADVLSYSDAAVAMGKSYEYRVFAYNSAGAGAAASTTATLLTLQEYGKQQYASRGCSACHGADAKGAKPIKPHTLSDLSALTTTISTTMPPKGTKCANNCAAATAQYVIELLAANTADPSTQVCAGKAPPSPRSLRLLTRQEYQNTVNDLLGLSVNLVNSMPAENRVDGFDNYVADNVVTGLRIEAFHTQALLLATQAVSKSWSKIVPCSTQDTACATKFIQAFGKKAYRRPLTTAEQADYLTLFNGNAFSAAVEISIGRMLASPNFLYRSELGVQQGDGTYRLTPYETASALSYLFLGSLPDDTLFSAADQNQLATSQQLEAQATRLLGLPRAREQVGNFVGQWLLSASPYALPDKDNVVYPRFTADVKFSMSNELINFFNHVALDSTQKFPELFSANYVVANKTLADFYGVGGSSGSNFSVLPVSDTTRFGIMTLGAVLSRYANSNESHPFKRGGFVYKRLLCDDLPPPANVGIVMAPKQDPNATTRQRFDFHSKSDASCWSCHQYMDAAGFTFEHYDGAGQYRATENGQPIDTSGTVLGIETFSPSEQVTVADLKGLSQVIANSPNAAQCVARQYYRYTTGKRESDADSCALGNYLQSYSTSGYNLKTMLTGIVTSPGFTLRRSN